jgi:hypothetical protein
LKTSRKPTARANTCALRRFLEGQSSSSGVDAGFRPRLLTTFCRRTCRVLVFFFWLWLSAVIGVSVMRFHLILGWHPTIRAGKHVQHGVNKPISRAHL